MATRSSSFLALGQRYAQLDAPSWRPDRQLTVARLDRDTYGLDRVTFMSGDGREFIAYTEQVEAAVAAGALVPVVEGFGKPLHA
jgi:hypothetical protein